MSAQTAAKHIRNALACVRVTDPETGRTVADLTSKFCAVYEALTGGGPCPFEVDFQGHDARVRDTFRTWAAVVHRAMWAL